MHPKTKKHIFAKQLIINQTFFPMKKFFVMAVMAIMAIGASAQWYVGGNLDFGQTKADGVKTTTFGIAPEVGYNFSENWAFGGTLDLGYTKQSGVKTTMIQVNPYARYTYFTSGNLNLFVDGVVGLGFGWSKAGGEKSDTAVSYAIGFKPGISYNLTEHFSLVAHVGLLGYQGGNDTYKDAGFPEEWGLHLNGSNLSFGFYYTF